MAEKLRQPLAYIIKSILMVIFSIIIISNLVMTAEAKDLPASTFMPFNDQQTLNFNNTERFIYPAEKDYIFISYYNDIMTGERDITAQKLDKDGKQIWKKTYNLKGDDTLKLLHMLKDGFVMAVSSQAAEQNILRLLTIDNSGKIAWQKDLPLKIVNSIASTNDGGLIVAGATGEDNQNIRIIKLDKTGNWKSADQNPSRWEKTYINSGNQQAHQIIQMLDKDDYNDGYILTGFTDYKSNGKRDLYLLRLDAYGEVNWSRNYGGQNDEQGITVGVMVNRNEEHMGYLVAGNSKTTSGEEKIYLIYVDKNGWNQSWPGYQIAIDGAKERYFGDVSGLMSMAIVPVPDAFKNNRKLQGENIKGDGGVLLIGYFLDNKNILAIRINEFGHVLWQKKLAVPGDNLIMGTLSKGDNEKQVIAYSATYPNQGRDMAIYTLTLYLEGVLKQDKTIPKEEQLETNYESIAWEKHSLKYEAMRDVSKEIKDLLLQQQHIPLTAGNSIKGEIEWPDFSYYLGNLVIGKADGEGTLFFTNGVWYKGSWKNNMFYGYGYLRFPTGEYYEGEFAEHMMHGSGVFKWPTGEKYAGQFLNNQRDGQGKFTWANGTYYEGGFKENEASGMGAINWPNGERYEGQMVQGKATGQGSYYFPNGERYRGEFKNLIFEGVGVYYWPDSSYYVGEFKQDRLNGEGYYVWPNGVIQHGYWKDDRYMGTNPNAEKTRKNW